MFLLLLVLSLSTLFILQEQIKFHQSFSHIFILAFIASVFRMDIGMDCHLESQNIIKIFCDFLAHSK